MSWFKRKKKEKMNELVNKEWLLEQGFSIDAFEVQRDNECETTLPIYYLDNIRIQGGYYTYFIYVDNKRVWMGEQLTKKTIEGFVYSNKYKF